jgi:hypothetical protein
MDCPSEERMIRMALTGFDSILSLSFDLSNRKLEIIHRGETGAISSKLETMGLGASLQRTEEASPESVRATESSSANDSVANSQINNALRRIPVEREHRFRECER